MCQMWSNRIGPRIYLLRDTTFYALIKVMPGRLPVRLFQYDCQCTYKVGCKMIIYLVGDGSCLLFNANATHDARQWTKKVETRGKNFLNGFELMKFRKR